MLKKSGNNWPVLLSGTIVQHTDAKAVWIDPRERERQYFSVLTKMASARNGVDTVFFCENSSANLESFSSLTSIYEKKCRKLLMYKVPMPVGSAFFGKGWGEGLIIRWALENVPELSSSNGFIKIVGRYDVVNLKRILTIIRRGLAKNPDIKFICQSLSPLSTTKQPCIETTFFWADTDFYVKYMLDLYEKVRDENGIYIEHLFADRLVELKDSFDFAFLPVPIIFRGRRGWDGYEISTRKAILEQEIKQILLPLPDLLPFNKVMCF